MNGLAVVPPLLGVPPLGVRVSELPFQWQGRGLGRVRVVAVHRCVVSRKIFASLLDVVGRLVGSGLADGGCGIGARKDRGDAGDGHSAQDRCALRKAQSSGSRSHVVYGTAVVAWRVESGDRRQTATLDLNARPSSVAVAVVELRSDVLLG
jgi:hypothetical protein